MTDFVLNNHICHLSVRLTQQYLKRCWGRAAPLGCCSKLPGQRALFGRRLKLWRRELGGSLGKPHNHCKKKKKTRKKSIKKKGLNEFGHRNALMLLFDIIFFFVSLCSPIARHLASFFSTT